MAAVVVTEALDWRLHGFDLLSEHAGAADMPLLNASWMVGSQYKPGEVGRIPHLGNPQLGALPLGACSEDDSL